MRLWQRWAKDEDIYLKEHYYEYSKTTLAIYLLRTKSAINGRARTLNLVMRKHGMSSHPLYKMFNNMISRCYNSNRNDFSHYGGRGIKINNIWNPKSIGYRQAWLNFSVWAQ